MSTNKKTEYTFDGTFHYVCGPDESTTLNGSVSRDKKGFFRSGSLITDKGQYNIIGHLKRDINEMHLLFAVKPTKDSDPLCIYSVSKHNTKYCISPQDVKAFEGTYTGGWYFSSETLDSVLVQDYDSLKKFAASTGPMIGCVELNLKIKDTIDKKVLKRA